MFAISARDQKEPPVAGTAFGTGGFYSPDGKFYTKDEGEYHCNWILENYNWLTKIKKVKLPSPIELNAMVQTRGADSVRNLLVGQGWIHVYSLNNMSLDSISMQESQLIDLLLDNKAYYAEDDEVDVFEISKDKYTSITPYKMLN
jgi:hypothetical protein